jgi:hypothetical protein
MWLCEQKPPKPIPPELRVLPILDNEHELINWNSFSRQKYIFSIILKQDRIEVPSYLKQQINNANRFRDDLKPGGDDPEVRARKQFNRDTKCDDPDSWLAPIWPRPDLPLTVANAPYYLNYWQKGDKSVKKWTFENLYNQHFLTFF